MDARETLKKELRLLAGNALSASWRAWTRSFHRAFVNGGALLVGAALLYYWRASSGAESAGDEAMSIILEFIFCVVAVGAIGFAATFLWNLWLAPYRQMREKVGEYQKAIRDEFGLLKAAFDNIEASAALVKRQQDAALEIMWEQRKHAWNAFPQAAKFWTMMAEIDQFAAPFALLSKVSDNADVAAGAEFVAKFEKSKWPDIDAYIKGLLDALPDEVSNELGGVPCGAQGPFLEVFDGNGVHEQIAGTYFARCDWLFTTVKPLAPLHFARFIGVPLGAGEKEGWMMDMRHKLGLVLENG